jgi:hypothetical protein
MNKLTLCLLGLVFPVLGHAQAVLDESQEDEIRRYTVEVIIFRYAQGVGLGSEVFLPDEPEQTEEPVIGDATDTPGEAESLPRVTAALPNELDEASEPLPDIELVLLEEDDYQLQETFGRLQRLDVYEPLMHFGWTQATWPEDQTEAIPLHLFARPPEELDGTLKLYLGRFLHLVVDLELQAPRQSTDVSSPESGFDGYTLTPGENRDVVSPPVFFRISEDRILRNGELRYYDHPKFGLLAKVTRVEAEAEPEQGELLGYPVQ